MSLEVYIDNIKRDIGLKEINTIGAIIIEINEMLEKEKKVAERIYINGERFSERHLYNPNYCVVEVTSVSQEKLFLEGLYNLSKYSQKYFALIEESYDYEEKDEELEEITLELVALYNWFLNFLISIKEEMDLNFEMPELDQYIEELKKEETPISETLKMRDSECLMDILEYEVAGVISRIAENNERYIELFISIIGKNKFIN